MSPQRHNSLWRFRIPKKTWLSNNLKMCNIQKSPTYVWWNWRFFWYSNPPPPPPLPHWLIIYWMWNNYLNTQDQTARQAEPIDWHHDRQTHHCGLRGSVIPELSAGGRLAYSGQYQWRSDSQRLHMSGFSQTNWFSSNTWMTAFWAY